MKTEALLPVVPRPRTPGRCWGAILRWLRLLKWFAPTHPINPVEYPQLARLRVVKVPCRFCGKGLDDGDLVVWFEKTDGWRSTPAHAACSVLVRKLDGTVVRLGGGEASGPMTPGLVLLTEEEWERWSRAAREQSLREELPEK